MPFFWLRLPAEVHIAVIMATKTAAKTSTNEPQILKQASNAH